MKSEEGSAAAESNLSPALSPTIHDQRRCKVRGVENIVEGSVLYFGALSEDD